MLLKKFAIILSLMVFSACDTGDEPVVPTQDSSSVQDTAVEADDTAVSLPEDTTTPPEEDTVLPTPDAVADTTTVIEDTASPEDAAGPGITDTVPPPGGKGDCDNAEDIALINAVLDTLADTMRKCALDCLGEEVCATDCVRKELEVSKACSACFGANIKCTMKKCALQCIDPESDKCLKCQEDNCNEDFEDCAGLAPPTS